MADLVLSEDEIADIRRAAEKLGSRKPNEREAALRAMSAFFNTDHASHALEPPTRQIVDVVTPAPLWPLADIIERSRWMLELADDFDGEGSPAYLEETWKRAATFLARNAVALYEECGEVIDAPNIHNGPQGSIDVYWNSARGRLLVNFPPQGTADPSFCGRSSDGHEIKGTLSPETENHWLILWHMGQK
jgi:hypothetical protein